MEVLFFQMEILFFRRHIRQELIGVSEDFFTKASVEYLGHINMGKLDWYIAFSSYYPT